MGLAVLLVAGAVGTALVRKSRDGADQPRWEGGPGALSAGGSTGAPAASPSARTVALSATGDNIIGNAPGRLPPGGGKGFYDQVKPALAADLVMGNLEEPLTDDTGVSKCDEGSSGCHQFRAPPSYAGILRDAGYRLLNQANNHGYDYGPAGYRNTQQALERYGLKHTGAPNEITVVELSGVTVAVVGFSSYVWSNSLIDIASAKKVIAKAAGMADLVVVQVHMGAEGSDKTKVKPGTELFLGENRGDPVKFSHAVIDAGADLVVGHGPHVLRAMEFYKGRLIAYSLGNFAGGQGTLSNSGRLAYGGVLKVSLAPDGTWAGGQFVSTYLNGAGRPTMDGKLRGLQLIQSLCKSDFPSTGAGLAADGKISVPAA